MKTSASRTMLLLASLLGLSAYAHGGGIDEVTAHFKKSPERLEKDCADLKASSTWLDAYHIQDLYDCYAYYYFVGGDNFKSSIAMGNRYLRQIPDDGEVAAHVAFLEVSRYRGNEKGLIDGDEGKDSLKNAIKIIRLSLKQKTLRNDPAYLLDASAVLYVGGRYYSRKDMSYHNDESTLNLVIQYSTDAERILAAKGDTGYLRIRALMNIGNMYRYMGKNEQALEWFAKVEKFDPNYGSLQTYIAELTPPEQHFDN